MSAAKRMRNQMLLMHQAADNLVKDSMHLLVVRFKFLQQSQNQALLSKSVLALQKSVHPPNSRDHEHHY